MQMQIQDQPRLLCLNFLPAFHPIPRTIEIRMGPENLLDDVRAEPMNSLEVAHQLRLVRKTAGALEWALKHPLAFILNTISIVTGTLPILFWYVLV